MTRTVNNIEQTFGKVNGGEPSSSVAFESGEQHVLDSLECVTTTTNNLPKFKAFSAPTPHHNHEHDFSDSNIVSSSSTCGTTNPSTRQKRVLYIQSSLESSSNNSTTFQILPPELIFDLIFPFLCIHDVLRFSSSCKLFHSYIFHIIEPSDSMWRQQLHNLVPFLNQLTYRRILEMNNLTKNDSKLSTTIKHKALIMQGVLQEYILKVRRRIQYFENEESSGKKGAGGVASKVFSIPPHYRTNAVACQNIFIAGSENEGFFELNEGSSIRSCVLSIGCGFLREFEAFSLQHVHIHEEYDTSQFNTTLKKKNSLKQLLKSHSLKNLNSENSEHSYFDNESHKHYLVSTPKNQKEDKESLPLYRMTFVGCSERAVHPSILQTFSKNQFPEDYISIYGQNVSCVASIKNTSTSEDQFFRLKLVDMPVDVWNSNDTGIYLKTSDTIIVIFNRRYKSSFDRVCNEIIPFIRKSSRNPKIILVGIDWLHTLLGNEQYESLRYKLSVDELLKLEPISHSRVIQKCSKIHVRKTKDKKKQEQPSIMAYIEFTPKDQNIAKDVSNLMDIILKLRVGSSKGVDFFSPSPVNISEKSPSSPHSPIISKLQLFKRKTSTDETKQEVSIPQPHIFSYSTVTSMSHNQLFNRKKSLKLKLKNFFSF